MKNLQERLGNETIPTLTTAEEEKLRQKWLEYDVKNGGHPMKFTEELAELIAAIGKYEAEPDKKNYERWLNVAEEVADVQIILEMIKSKYNISDAILSKIRTLKLTVPIPGTEETAPQPEKEEATSTEKVISTVKNMVEELDKFRKDVEEILADMTPHLFLNEMKILSYNRVWGGKHSSVKKKFNKSTIKQMGRRCTRR